MQIAILKACKKKPQKLTQLMYAANINMTVLKGHLQDLSDRQLVNIIENDVRLRRPSLNGNYLTRHNLVKPYTKKKLLYSITDKGLLAVSRFEEFESCFGVSVLVGELLYDSQS